MNTTNQVNLFSQFTTNSLTLQNRIVMAPMTRMQSPASIPTLEVAEYYQQRAKGGAGLLITECTFINHPVANGFAGAPAFHGKEALEGWQRVVNKVHEVGGKIVPQIWHAGAARSMNTTPNETMLSIGPMDIYENNQHTVRGMTKDDIENVIDAFTIASIDAKNLGFDGVEIHGAHSYLIDQFFWKESNQRTDEYGGNLKNRIKFACQLVESIRCAVGKEFPIIFRFSQWKLSDYTAKIALDSQELEEFLIPLIKAGVDIFHVSTRRFWEPAFDGSELSLAGWTRKITGKPVITVGSVGIDNEFSLDIFSSHIQSKPKSIELVESMLQNKEFDLVAVGRSILADPEWPHKIESGQLDKIIPFSSKSLETL